LDKKTNEIKEIIREGKPIDDIHVFKDFIAVEERHEAPDFRSDRVRFGEEPFMSTIPIN